MSTAAYDPTSPLRRFSFERRAPGPRDVQIDILCCGAVGGMVDSCRTCDSCRAALEQSCDRSETTYTYNSKDQRGPVR
jgi:uncharacterized zinc-type alcohol dehydrogenase-like protein